MFIFILFFLLGILVSLIPGLHPNTLFSLFSSFFSESLDVAVPIILGVYVVLSFLPPILLGIPENDNVITLLPAQRLLAQGKGRDAIRVIALSSMATAVLCLFLLPFVEILFPLVFSFVRPFIPFILILFSFILISKKKPILSAAIFLSSGLIGVFSLSNIDEPFLPMFSGFFALPFLFDSLFEFSSRKKIFHKEEEKRFSLFPVFLGLSGGFLADFLPAISSPSQSALFFLLFFNLQSIEYISFISSTVLSQAFFSFITAREIGKARVGAVSYLLSSGRITDIQILLFFFSSLFASFLLFAFRKRLSTLTLPKGRMPLYLIAGYLFLLVFFLSGPLGLLVLILSSILGFLCVRFGIPRTLLMASVILPTLLYYLF